MTKLIEFTRMDAALPNPLQCEWCGCVQVSKLRVSARFEPRPRFLMFCTSCRAREADGQLDEYGKPTKKA